LIILRKEQVWLHVEFKTVNVASLRHFVEFWGGYVQMIKGSISRMHKTHVLIWVAIFILYMGEIHGYMYVITMAL
jgi:hypothetical protein